MNDSPNEILSRIETLTDWVENQAEAIIDAFAADGGPDDLFRLQQAIANALRLAYERGRDKQSARAHVSLGQKGKVRKNPSRSRLR